MRLRPTMCFAVVALLVIPGTALAPNITPTGASASSTFGTEYAPLHLIDNSGLSGGMHDSD
jgi:hypothetical protein